MMGISKVLISVSRSRLTFNLVLQSSGFLFTGRKIRIGYLRL